MPYPIANNMSLRRADIPIQLIPLSPHTVFWLDKERIKLDISNYESGPIWSAL